jgi:hypothetical protein
MAKKLLGVLVDVKNNEAKAMEIDDDLNEFYRILNCTCIDIVQRRIGARLKKSFTIVCDDEGLFYESPKISAIDNMGNAQLVGNIFIVAAGDDGEGNLVSLTEYDVSYIMSKIQKMSTRKYPDPYVMLTQCEF